MQAGCRVSGVAVPNVQRTLYIPDQNTTKLKGVYFPHANARAPKASGDSPGLSVPDRAFGTSRTRSPERLDDTNPDRCAAKSPLGARRMDILDASHVCVHENSRDPDTPASFSLRNPPAFFVLSHNLAWMLLLDRTTAPMQLALLPTRRLD
jgi:hypothetical protein